MSHIDRLRGEVRAYLFRRRRRRHGQLTVGDAPYLPPNSLAAFAGALAECSSYLEYGSGGSTVAAALSGKPFVSVDSDREFLRVVERRVAELAPDSPATLLHADIGPTVKWGAPAVRTRTPKALTSWRDYAQLPWRRLGDRKPDLVFVDGRFRVACALVSIAQLAGTPWRMLIDDYHERPHYHAVEQFAELAVMHGRMAEFRPTSVDPAELQRVLKAFEADWR